MRKNPPDCCNQLAACSLSLRVLPGCLPACCPYCPAGSVHAWRRSRGQGGRGNGNVGKTFPRAAPELLWLDEKEICILTDATGINIWLLAIFSWQNNRRPAASCCCCYLLWKPQLKWPTTIRPIASCELRTANCEWFSQKSCASWGRGEGAGWMRARYIDPVDIWYATKSLGNSNRSGHNCCCCCSHCCCCCTSLVKTNSAQLDSSLLALAFVFACVAGFFFFLESHWQQLIGKVSLPSLSPALPGPAALRSNP